MNAPKTPPKNPMNAKGERSLRAATTTITVDLSEKERLEIIAEANGVSIGATATRAIREFNDREFDAASDKMPTNSIGSDKFNRSITLPLTADEVLANNCRARHESVNQFARRAFIQADGSRELMHAMGVPSIYDGGDPAKIANALSRDIDELAVVHQSDPCEPLVDACIAEFENVGILTPFFTPNPYGIAHPR